MVLLSVGFNMLTFEVATHPVEVKRQSFVHHFSEDLFPVFDNKNQMQVKRTALAVGSRTPLGLAQANLLEPVRKYCPWLHRSQRNRLSSREA